MNPDDQFNFEGLDPASRYTMRGLNMAYATELREDGKPLSKELFLDIMIGKTQMLLIHLKHLHLVGRLFSLEQNSI